VLVVFLRGRMNNTSNHPSYAQTEDHHEVEVEHKIKITGYDLDKVINVLDGTVELDELDCSELDVIEKFVLQFVKGLN
tara:strand:+ start:1680 stop:1913 length:234 start_codon:yes stop_codon:yes gene_type:complete